MLKSIISKIFYSLLMLLVGMVIGSLLCSKDTKDIAVKIEPGDIDVDFDSTETTEKILDKKDYPREFTISTPGGDIRIDSMTPYGEIPAIETRWRGKQDFMINNKLASGNYNALIIHTGDIHKLRLWFDPINTKIEVPKPGPCHLYIEIDTWIDQNVNWHGALAGNLWYRNFAIDGRIIANPIKREDEKEYKISFLIGFSYRFKVF